MTKKIGIYIGLVIFGFLISYLIFGRQNDEDGTAKNNVESTLTQIWTCAMHPQIKENESGICALCAMDLVVVTSNEGDDILLTNQFKMTKKALALANIKTSQVGYNTEDDTKIKLFGVITTNKETDATQTTLFDGRIEKLHANYVGKKIYKGNKIGLIYSPELYVAQNSLLSSASYREKHPTLFDEMRNTAGLWKLTDKQIDELIMTGKPIVNFPIYADVSGTITEILGSEGSYYKQGDPIFKISNLRTLWAVFDAYENQLASLKEGQDVDLKLSAFSDGTITGKINFIEPLLDKQKRTASVRVILNNKNGKLKPGMFVEAQIKSNRSKGILTIPKTAALWTGKRSIVYRLPNPNQPIFELTEVVIGQSLGDSYEVLSGLENGDYIVTDGAFTVDAAAQLSGKQSMMSSNHTNDHSMRAIDDEDINNKMTPLDLKMIKKDEFNLLIKDYISLKDAFVSTDAKTTKHHAKEMFKKFNKIDLKQLDEADKKNIDSVKGLIKTLIASSDIEKQRLHFKALSQMMIDLVSKSKNLNETVYIQFCPMADDNKGAKWLSLEKNITNPYFGNKMLTCGSILEEINN